MRKIALTLMISLGFVSSLASAKVRVVTSLTDIAWAARQIGGDKVEVTSLLTGTEDPHFADAVPRYIKEASKADVVCVVGLGLEIGWMPKVLSKSGNANVQPGAKGYCELGKSVTVLDRPTGAVDRSMGDVHPEGNPHFWLGPKAFVESAISIKNALQAADAAHSADYDKGYENFKKAVEANYAANQAKFKNSKLDWTKLKITQYHSEFAYYFRDYALTGYPSIEEKPGVAPSAGRLAKVSSSAKSDGVALALASEHNPKDVLDKFKEISGIPVVIVPTSIHQDPPHDDYLKLQDYITDQIIANIRK